MNMTQSMDLNGESLTSEIRGKIKMTDPGSYFFNRAHEVTHLITSKSSRVYGNEDLGTKRCLASMFSYVLYIEKTRLNLIHQPLISQSVYNEIIGNPYISKIINISVQEITQYLQSLSVDYEIEIDTWSDPDDNEGPDEIFISTNISWLNYDNILVIWDNISDYIEQRINSLCLNNDSEESEIRSVEDRLIIEFNPMNHD